MEYSIQKLAAMSGVTTRTLRYYDQIGLLKPLRISSSGYRVYGPEQVDRLQQILFYRELGFPLEEIRRLVTDPGYDRRRAMEELLHALRADRTRLGVLIKNLTKTIESEDRKERMNDTEKFAGFKRRMAEENEARYGEELKRRYGAETMKKSNDKWMSMTKEQYERMQRLADEILAGLEAAVRAGEDPAGEEGRRLAALHKEWLCFTWPSYSAKAHRGLAEGYVQDERFRAYYDRQVNGCAAFLRDAVRSWLETA